MPILLIILMMFIATHSNTIADTMETKNSKVITTYLVGSDSVKYPVSVVEITGSSITERAFSSDSVYINNVDSIIKYTTDDLVRIEYYRNTKSVNLYKYMLILNYTTPHTIRFDSKKYVREPVENKPAYIGDITNLNVSLTYTKYLKVVFNHEIREIYSNANSIVGIIVTLVPYNHSESSISNCSEIELNG